MRDTLQCNVFPVFFLDIEFCVFASHQVYKTSVSPVSGEKKKAITLEMELKRMAQM